MARKKKQAGNGVMDVLRSINNGLKSTKAISRGLAYFPHPAAQLAAQAAKLVGYGKRKRARRPKKVMVGNGIFSDLGGGIGGIAHGLFGAGRRRPRRKAALFNSVA